MAVYLFTFHTYRSWMPDHRRGYVKRGRGIQKPDADMAESYARRAGFERIRLDDTACHVALAALQRVCNTPSRAGWRLHIAVAVFNHIHALISWPGFIEADRAKAVLHRAATVDLRDALKLPTARPVLSRAGSRKRIHSRPHFNHLLHTYLPTHRKYGGAILRENAKP